MAISDKKIRIVIENYFKTECDVNTSIREAFEKGFRIGVTKGMQIKSELPKDNYDFSKYACGVTDLPCCGCSLFCEHRKIIKTHI